MNKENIDITNVILKTNRLVLRTFKLTDLDDFMSMLVLKALVK